MFKIRFWPMTARPMRAMSALGSIKWVLLKRGRGEYSSAPGGREDFGRSHSIRDGAVARAQSPRTKMPARLKAGRRAATRNRRVERRQALFGMAPAMERNRRREARRLENSAAPHARRARARESGGIPRPTDHGTLRARSARDLESSI